MARSKNTVFTDTMIKKLKSEDKKYIRSEGNGFTIRILPTGCKTWLYLYSIDGKRREMNLGSYPDVTLERARDKLDGAKKKVKNGIDPLAEEATEVEAQRNAPTIKILCEEYIERHAKCFKKSWREDERIVNNEVIPAWGNRKAADIVKRDVLRLLESILDRGSPGSANNIFQVIRKMFNFAVERDVLPFSPCNGLKLPAKKIARERALSETETKDFLTNLTVCSMSAELRYALMLILITAQRPGEVIGLHTNEIDGVWWTIPADRAKNGKTHRVPLSALAVGIIQQAIAHIRKVREIPLDVEYSGFIFPSPHLKKSMSITRHALAVATNRNLAWPLTDDKGNPVVDDDGKPVTENRFGIDHFTPHDLRRTAATFMAQSGEMDEVIDAVLNHAKQGVIKVYNQYRYDDEKKMALEELEYKLNCIIAGKKYRTPKQRDADQRAAEEKKNKVVDIKQGRRKAA